MVTKVSQVNSAASVAGERSAKTTHSNTSHTLLLIEDDLQIAQLVITELGEASYQVDWAPDGHTGLKKYGSGKAQLIVLDLNLPDIDGLDVCARIRQQDRLTPILMLTARATKQEIVRGLELGADEYLTKPFDTLEFLARIRALFRRVAEYQSRGSVAALAEPVHCGHLTMDPLRREAHIDTRSLALTAKEFELLLLFIKHPGRTFTRDELLGRVWGNGFEGFEHTVNTHINRLRNKVEEDAKNPRLIETVWGVGYRLATPKMM